jgi:hypothetical protein
MKAVEAHYREIDFTWTNVIAPSAGRGGELSCKTCAPRRLPAL